MVALSAVRISWACARVFRLKVHATFLYFIKDNIIVSTFCMLVKCENKLGVLLVARGQLSFAGVTCARVRSSQNGRPKVGRNQPPLFFCLVYLWSTTSI